MTEVNVNQTVHDPVCHMDIDIRMAAGRSDHDGMTYYFCSPGCKTEFDADPEGVLKAEAEYDHSQPNAMENEMATASTGPAMPNQGKPKAWWQFWR